MLPDRWNPSRLAKTARARAGEIGDEAVRHLQHWRLRPTDTGGSSDLPRLSIGLGGSHAPHRKWTAVAVYKCALIVGACLIVAQSLPADAWRDTSGQMLAVLGGIGLWRYSWWLTHLVRAKVYELHTYPRLAAEAAVAWRRGWRPPRVHVLLTTYREPRATAEAVVQGICAEIRAIGQPATIWIGSREAPDENNLLRHFKLVGSDLDLQIRVIRQTQPGKRVAIALLLRAMARDGLGANDFVAFMDGDFVLLPGALSRSLALFATDSRLHAVTTDEDVVVHGPAWVQSWLALRFAQRRLTMQSHAQSGRVLTLTAHDLLLATGREFVVQALAHQDPFASLGIPKEFATALTADLDALEAAMSAKADAISDKAGATAGIDQQIQLGMDAEIFLDALMFNVYTDDPVKYAAWKTARHVKRAPQHAPTPPTP